MGKWLAIGGVVVIALLLLLLREMRSTDAHSAPGTAHEPAAGHSPLAAPAAAPVAAVPAVVAPGAAAPTQPVAEAAKPGKLDPRSDEFFYKFDETIPKVLTRNAAKCYDGRSGSLQRNQKLSLNYKVKVVNGEVVVQDVKIKESTLNDSALETCFIQAVQRSTWKDDELPDVTIDDTIVLRPERGMRKYSRENMDYVGAEAPRQ